MNSPAALPASKKHLRLYPECPILSRVSWECPILSGVSNTVRSVRFETGHVNTWYCPECVRSCPECVRSCPECVRNVSGDAVRSCPKRVSGMSGNVRECPVKCPECPIRAQLLLGLSRRARAGRGARYYRQGLCALRGSALRLRASPGASASGSYPAV